MFPVMEITHELAMIVAMWQKNLKTKLMDLTVQDWYHCKVLEIPC